MEMCCQKCFKEKEIVKFIETHGKMGICPFCGNPDALTFSTKEVGMFIRAGLNKAYERLAGRVEKVAPKVALFFKYIHSLAESEEFLSGRLKKAVAYAINQEQYLKRFLSDGNIPIDNGHVERIIAHSYSIGRANWLFADTINGAKVNAMVYSIVETARANHADVRCYLQYLFEEMPKQLGSGDRRCLADMVPWSTTYNEYEKNERQSDLEQIRNLFHEPDKPRTPWKRDPVINIHPNSEPSKVLSCVYQHNYLIQPVSRRSRVYSQYN